jgi:RimJ/RimL family protein N-acetyltransferase
LTSITYVKIFRDAQSRLPHLIPTNNVHSDFVYELNNSPELLLVHQKRQVPIPTRESTLKFIEKNAASMEKQGYGRYLISRRPESHIGPNGTQEDERIPFSQSVNTYELIGTVSMHRDRFPSAPQIPDLGFAILAKHYGKGYATEAAQGLMQYYREEKGQTAFSGYCHPENESSKKVFRRLGFEERGVRDVNGLKSGGELSTCLVWTLGAEGALEEYGL